MREAKNDKYTPRWFNLTEEISPTPWGDLEIYEYNGKYSEHRAQIESSTSLTDADPTTIEFNPWQYSDVAE